jgi:hypothetical protein
LNLQKERGGGSGAGGLDVPDVAVRIEVGIIFKGCERLALGNRKTKLWRPVVSGLTLHA